ncbi:alpha/beta hydrolase [Nocardia asteroides NBRC 15531]|uniref:Hydrolase n=1 Tax=Nocardia asteroides NBRC 15531 TaxID=1110697 RepID=U5ELQ9_NOCAS|nr:alpha/beta hydrolase [Nocardia asteroides]TLF63580.1 alpha/beta hydrolase [Nocardia asteroides NBRC 15531]UGT46969.1 alpha/beta hydrolase [Nocardia asteroides]SFM83391.1 Pimeloyl-ACP methyl ester carboxylesterase [Nocardia asteroides]VEG34166.1 2-hydroxy-6-oxo-6-phenylhexa-2,4-dienoate hydrolase [Nocardia asteroides]GAD87326.1 putative hydrolase [Nocardia asteroides NBRC 15531]
MKLTAFALTAAVAVTALLSACGSDQTTTAAPDPGAYAEVNGLRMYYERHGVATDQPPLVLLHGALSGIGTDFGELIPELARTREVIAIEQQAHGRTADIDRPLRTPQMADDTVALLAQLGIHRVDVLGYSMGAGVALDITLRHPELVRKQILLSGGLGAEAMHPGLMEGMDELKPEHLHGSTFHTDYLKNAPRPEDFPRLVAEVLDHDLNGMPSVSHEAARKVEAPTLTIIGDSDIVRPEHSVEMFRLFGGGVMGDTPAGLPNAQLAILPGTSHITAPHRPELLLPMIPAFLDAPVKDAR